MEETIKNFAKQFSYEPVIENIDNLQKRNHFVVLGMGGSHLGGDILKTVEPYSSSVIVHSDYGLPNLLEEVLKNSLIIASSYSGNTEEVIDGLNAALEKNLAIVCIAVGGKLIDIAKEKNLPHIQMPNTGIQPRSAVGFSFRAMLKAVGDEKLLAETQTLANSLKAENFQEDGKNLATRIKGLIPIIYASTKKYTIAYNWKIKLNETGKVPAFCSVVPEANHNEINSFEVPELAQKFCAIFLEDSYDNPRNQKRMSVVADLYQQRGLKVEKIKLEGQNHFHKIFSSLLLADWTAYYLAKSYGQDSEQVKIVEDFKKLIG